LVCKGRAVMLAAHIELITSAALGNVARIRR
jgi:hypothetical protein